ncbi:MAG: transcription antiterminator [Planococcus sp. (in: Bacteria)]|nr:transcription antiterminator [Planococcus sp. (in: firmicutes)]
MLTSRMKNIFRELMAAETPITGKYLAVLNQVSSRTIREDIKALDSLLIDHGAYIDSVMGQGYKLGIMEEPLFRSYLKKLSTEDAELKTIIPKMPEERIAYLVKRFLLSDGYIKLEELADEMYISKSTLQNDLNQVKKMLAVYDIRLESRPNYGLRVNADELKRRFCMAEYIFVREEPVNELFKPHFSSLSQEELDSILAVVMEQIQENKVLVSDIAINNLVIHLAIAYKRIKEGYNVTLHSSDIDEILEQKEYKVAQNIVRKVQEKFAVHFPLEEVAYIAMHLLGTKIAAHPEAGEKAVQQVIQKEISGLVIKALERIESKLNLGIQNDQELIIALSLHLKPAVNRYRYGMNIRNPMLEDIKVNYPVAFEAGILAGMTINEAIGAVIDENEIGYLALHIAAAIEQKKSTSVPKRCLIVCASGLGTAQLIYYKLKSQFGDGLEVAGTTEYYKLKNCELAGIDFIISSIPIQEELAVPVIVVNAILGEPDIRKIEKYILKEQQHISAYFQEELIFLGQELRTKEQVLEFLHEKLIERGLVDEGCLQAVYERERVAPTSFGNLVAIPHPITPHSTTTFLTVCTLKKPIMWKEKPVQFVCLLNVMKDSQEDLQVMYDLLGRIIHDSAIVERLTKAKTYEEFMKVIAL